ncbi:MAG: hypothetical protein JWL80_305 [Parcubacteria group bacterium]|nr:hypothetical protein [Parcubacteria group bacterium]
MPLWLIVIIPIALAIIILMSVDTLPPNRYGAIDFLGLAFYEAGPGGPVIVVKGLMHMKVFDSPLHEKEIPDEPEFVQKDHQDHVDTGKKATIRISQRGANTALWIDVARFKKEGKNFDKFLDYLVPLGTYAKANGYDEETVEAIKADPYNQADTTEVSGIFAWRHRKADGFGNPQGGCFDFIRNIHSLEEADKRIEDEMVRSFQRILNVITPGHAFEHSDIISDYTLHMLEILIGEEEDKTSPKRKCLPRWGIDLTKAAIKLIDPGERFNIAVASAAASAARRQEVIRDAEATKAATELVAQGTAYAEAKIGMGKARGAGAMAKVMQTPEGRQAAAQASAERVAEKADFIITNSNDGALTGTVAAMAKSAIAAFAGSTPPTQLNRDKKK